QFAHHLVLFDLPLNPDLLEQRIGRLDRIGQRETIRIHVPYLEHGAQATLFHWYQRGLSAFEHTCPAGHSVFVRVKDDLLRCLQGASPADMERLIDTSRALHAQLTAALQNGRDRLLEYNSCRPEIANRLKQQAQAADRNSELPDYLDAIFDCFGVDTEIHGTCSYVLHPGEHMQAPLPGLSDEGMTVTYDRDTALAFENMQYLTWEHPLTRTAMDMVLSSELGSTALTAVKYRGVNSGTLLMECLFILESASSERLNSARYLPPTCIRVLIDQSGRRHDDALPHAAINRARQNVERETAAQVIRSQLDVLKTMAKTAEAQAAGEAPTILREALGKTRDTLQGEIQRLEALQRVNPNVRDEEIRYFEEQWTALSQALESASLRLDALRVIVAV
ncbi:MAG TPA: RNA polymerase-associated protein RapA, partial [Gammaproteobacteria bacterium]|nr:RNA polymerase-associated protein RapA [Gammaproteobacteria bacterium]